MADDKTKRGPADSRRINIHEDYEVAYWKDIFCVTKEELVDAVKHAGTSADAVQDYLEKGSSKS